MDGERRLGADQAALAFQAFQQGGFFAADIGAGAHPQLDVEAVVRTGDVLAGRFARSAARSPP